MESAIAIQTVFGVRWCVGAVVLRVGGARHCHCATSPPRRRNAVGLAGRVGFAWVSYHFSSSIFAPSGGAKNVSKVSGRNSTSVRVVLVARSPRSDFSTSQG